MPVFTPRGLKIRLDSPYVFSLIGRIWSKDQKRDAFRVLKTCEGVEQLDTMLAYVSGLVVGLCTSYPVWAITIAIVVGRFVGFLILRFRIFDHPSLVALATTMSYFSGYGIFHGIALALLVWQVAWASALAWLAGFFVAFCVDFLLSAQWTKSIYHEAGVPLTRSEFDFFYAYYLHAVELGITQDLEVTEEEQASGLWKECLTDYARKYPRAVARFDAAAAEPWLMVETLRRTLRR